MAKMVELKKLTKEQKEKACEKFITQFVKFIKGGGGRIGLTEFYPSNGSMVVMVEHNLGNLSRDFKYIVSESDDVKVDYCSHIDGFYHWDTDTYSKPCDSVTFDFTR